MFGGRTLLLLTVIPMAVAIQPLFACDNIWNGSTSSDWGNASNWSKNAVPASAEWVLVPAGVPRYPEINSGTFCTGTLQVEAGASISMTGGTLNISGDWKNAGTFDATGGAIVFAQSGSGDFATGVNQFFNITVLAGVDPDFDRVLNSAILIRGNFTNNNTGLSNSTRSSFTFNGTDNQAIYSVSSGSRATFGHLTINKSGGTITLTSTLRISGNANVTNGKLDLGPNTFTRSSNGGSLIVGNGGTLRIGGTNGMPLSFATRAFAPSSTVEYNGTGQSIAPQDYGNLVLSGTGNVCLSGSMSIAGNFTIGGSVNTTASGAITVNGDFEVADGTAFNAGNYTHTVKGHFSNNGSFAAGTSTFTLDGLSQQQANGCNPTVFNNLLVDNGAGVLLNTHATISGTLTLQNGKVFPGFCNLTVTGTISGASAAAYVVTNGTGRLIRPAGSSTATEFPVGTESSYNPVGVRTTTGIDNFSVRVLEGVSPSTPNDPAAVQRTWDISESVGGGNGVIFVDVHWNDGEQGTIFDRTLAETWRNSGSSWTPQSGSLSGITSGTTYPAVATFQTQSLGHFAIANNDGALPIQLVQFGAAIIENTNNVRVGWTTLTETNNYGFFVQRSSGNENGYADQPNSFVAGHGTTLEPHTYQWIDFNLNSGPYYYRLKQIDLDGTIHYSDGVRVEVLGPTSVAGTSPLAFGLSQNYPNPFNPSTTIEFSVESSSFATLEVFNILGQKIATLFSDMASPGQSYRVRFDASGVANGIYFAKLVSGKKEALRTMILTK